MTPVSDAGPHRPASCLALPMLVALIGLWLASCSDGFSSAGPADPGQAPGDPNHGPGSGGGSSLPGGIGPAPVAEDGPLPEEARYVSPAGDDGNPGTETQPWRTMAHALAQLVAGDTLVLRQGSYDERSLRVACAGTSSRPIVIRNHPGEAPTIDGSLPAFRTPNTGAWQLHDAGRKIWRSTATFSGLGQVYGFFGDADGGHRLVPYERYADLAADTEDYAEGAPYYCGAGAFWNSADRRIYVRLVRSRHQQRFGLSVPADESPQATPLRLFPAASLLEVTAQAAHVTFSGIRMHCAERIADVSGGSAGLVLRRCELRPGRYGLVVRSGFSGLVCDGIEVRGGFPPWVARSDVKADANPAHLMQDAAFEISGAVADVEIRNSRFVALFDAIDTYGMPVGMRVHHCEFDTIRDDVFEIATAGYDIRFDHNLARRVTAGVSWNGSTPPLHPGRKHIDHNVIDVSQKQLYGRDDPQRLSQPSWLGPDGDGMATGPVFSLHDTGSLNGPDPWKVYANTFVGGCDVDGEGLGLCYAFPGASASWPHEVFNNVLIQTGDQWILRRARVHDGSQRYDGNLYFRSEPQPSTTFLADYSGGGSARDFVSLAAFSASSLWPLTRSFYAPGWEASGVEADPQLDALYRPAAGGPAASGAVDLGATGWPDADGAPHRGAVPPAH